MTGKPNAFRDPAEVMLRHIGYFHLLLVEDSPSDARLIESFVGEVPGCRLYVARDAQEAMDFLYRRGSYASAPIPHVIILDWNLPGKGGDKVLECIKGDVGLHSIPVVVLSSSSADASVLQAYDLRANCWVVKSTELSDQSRRIRTLIDFWAHTAQLPRTPPGSEPDGR